MDLAVGFLRILYGQAGFSWLETKSLPARLGAPLLLGTTQTWKESVWLGAAGRSCGGQGMPWRAKSLRTPQGPSLLGSHSPHKAQEEAIEI